MRSASVLVATPGRLNDFLQAGQVGRPVAFLLEFLNNLRGALGTE
jgi:superfamily II DNA/RNA helicase